MKKVLSIIIAAVLTAALCISATATLNIDRMFVNQNYMDGPNVLNQDPVKINAGDKLYILGWAFGEASNLKEIVYNIDGGEDVHLSDNYRDRADVAQVFGLDASFGEHAGFGHDAAEDGGLLELTGIEDLPEGTYKLTVKAIYNDETYEAKEFNLQIGNGGNGGEDPGIPENYIEIELTAEAASGVDVEEVDGKLICTTAAANDPWVSIPLDVDTSVYKYFTVTYRATKEIGANNTYLKQGGYIGAPDGGDWEPHGMLGTADGEIHTAVYSIEEGFPTFINTTITGIRLTCCGEEGGVFTIESIKFYGDEDEQPDYLWLCDPEGPCSTGWWMHPFTENDWDFAVRFESPMAFDGFSAFAFANPDGSTVIIRLYDDYGNVLEEFEHTQTGDGPFTVEFSRGYADGNYVLEFCSTDSGEWFVMGSGYYGEVWCEIYGNCNINSDTLDAPYMNLSVYKGNSPYRPAPKGDAVVYNPDDTTLVWVNRDEIAQSFDTFYIDGVSHMELGWGGDGMADGKLSDNPVTVGDASTITMRGWAGIKGDPTIVLFGYRINGGENVYDEGFARETEYPVIAAGGDSRFEITVPVAGYTEPTLITAVAKGDDGVEYDLIQFSVNGQYENQIIIPEPHQAAVIDPSELYELYLNSPATNQIDAALIYEYDYDYAYCTFYALGGDPFFVFAEPLNVGENNKTAVVKYRSNDPGFRTMDFYLKIAEPHARSEVNPNGSWNYAIFDLSEPFPAGMESLWDGTIARFDPMSGEIDGASVDIAFIRFFESEEQAAEWIAGLEDAKLNIIVDGAEEPVEYNVIGGDTVEIKINLTNNYGVSSLRGVVDWSDKLTLINAEYNIYNENDKSAMVNEPEEGWESVTSPFVFNWLTARNIVEGDCTYVTLTFKVSDDVKAGDFLPVNIEVSPIDLFADLNTRVPFTSENGGVTVVSYFVGDVDDDGVVCNKDVVALFRYVNGTIDPELVNERALDVNGDGAVNNKDIVALFKLVSGEDDIVVPR